MKKITLLFAFLITSIGFSQTELLTNGDFSNDKDSWSGSEFTVVSGEAFFASTAAGGNPWDTQLVQGSLSFVASQEYVLTFKARSTVNRKITVAIQNVGAWDDQFRQDFDITSTMTEYTATFNAAATNGNVQIGFLMAGFGNTEGVYYDDISLTTTGSTGGGGSSTPPTTAAPTPITRNAWDVISLYSDAYTATALTNFDAAWCGANSVEEIQVESDNVLAWKANACQGIELTAIDATAFTHLHVDVFIEAGTDVTSSVFNLKFVDTADNQFKEINFNAGTSPALEAGKWISIDVAVDLADYDKWNQFGITSNLNNKVWYDNLYVYRAPTANVKNNDLLQFSMFPNPTANTLNISAKDVIENAEVFNVLGKKVKTFTINKTKESLDISDLSSGIYLIKYNVGNAVGTAKFIKQ